MTVETALGRLQAMLAENVEKLGAVGVLAALDIPGRPRIHVAAGRRGRDGEAALGADDLYQIGSQTKTLVAIALLLLARDGVLDLDDAVAAHLDLPIDPRITLKHLIMNTSGLGEYTAATFGQKRIGVPLAPRDLVALALPQGQLFPPGDHFDYCNTGWAIAAMVLEARAPGGYPGFVRKRIFEPLGLANAYIAAAGDYPKERMASGYVRTADTDGLVDTGRDFDMTWAYGAGDGIADCGDMIGLYRALLDPGNAMGVSLADLTREVAAASDAPAFPLSLGGEYAYGLERRGWGGRPVWGHPGRTLGYSTSTWAEPVSGVIVATAFMNVWDFLEPPALAGLRYNAQLIFTQALLTAYQIQEAAG